MVFNCLETLVANLPLEEIERALDSGEITIEEIVKKFELFLRQELEEG